MRTRQRFLAAATATVVALGMSLGGASVALATPEDETTETTETTEVVTSEGEGLASAESVVVPDEVEGASVPPAVTASSNGSAKVFVCKYVGTPGVDERLQTGNNPISVSVNAIPDYQGVGSYFADAHGRSYVLAEDNRTGGGQEGEPSVSECPAPDGPTEVFPAATATQFTCVDDQVVGGFITVDLSVPGVSYSVEDSNGDTVAFDPSSGQTSVLDVGTYTVFGDDASDADTFAASSYEQEFTIDEFTELCGDLPTSPNWPASVTVTDETCVEYTVTDGAIDVVFPEGSEENPNPIRYFIDYEGEDEQELTEESTVVPAGDYVVTAVVTDPNDSVNDSGTSVEFPVTVEGVDAAACTDLPSYPNWPASVTVTDEECVQFSVTDGKINVVFPEGSEENPNPIRYFIDYEGEDEQELTEESTVVPAGSYVVTAVVTDPNDSVNDSGTTAEFPVTVEGVDAEECDFDFPTFPNWPASVSTTDEVCGPFDVVSGAITVTFPTGSLENPTPVRYFIDYEGEDEQELTEETTEVPAGSYVVTAVVTDPNDSVNDSGTSDEFEVVVAAQDADECGELETLAYTGASDLTGAFGLAALLVTLTGMGMVVARRRVEA